MFLPLSYYILQTRQVEERGDGAETMVEILYLALASRAHQMIRYFCGCQLRLASCMERREACLVGRVLTSLLLQLQPYGIVRCYRLLALWVALVLL